MESDTSEERGSVSMVLNRLHNGEESQFEVLWERFFPRLVGVARHTLCHLPHRADDAADAAQSALISFWQKTQREDMFQLLDRNSLWKLLATITSRKAKRIVRREHTLKRGGGQAIVRDNELRGEDGGGIEQLLQTAPSESFDLVCEEWLGQLDDELRQYAVLRLFGHTNREIAKLMDCTERKVERKLNRIRQNLSRTVDL